MLSLLLNARRFMMGASPELKFRTTNETDTAHVVSELPTARKPWYIFSPEFVQIATFLASNPNARHCLFWVIRHRRFHYSLSFALFCRKQGKNSVVLINVAINFGYEYFRFAIYFLIFFCQNFFPTFCSKIFFQNFFFKQFSTFFFNIVFQKFCS